MRNTSSSIQRSLTCLSGNGLVSHSLFIDTEGTSAFIRSHFLPIETSNDAKDETHEHLVEEVNRQGSRNPIQMVETELSETVIASLKIDPAIELVCVDHNLSNPTTLSSDLPKQRHRFPLLALYSASSLWLLTITYTTQNSQLSSGAKFILKGKLAKVQEPFEETLLSCHSSTRIIRVRAPPSLNSQNRNVVLCPPGCMAMLTSEGSVILNHTRSARADARSQQFRRRKEISKTRYSFNDADDSEDEEDEREFPLSDKEVSYYTTTPMYLSLGGDDVDLDPITDFCFGNSSFDIFSIYILRASGNVFSANPILFDGTAIPRTLFQDRMQQLNSKLKCIESSLQQDSAHNDSSVIAPLVLESRMPEKEETNMDISSMVQSQVYKEAQMRRIKAEKQFLMDSFPDHLNAFKNVPSTQKSGYYITSCLRGNGGSNATLWPVQCQGPLLYGRSVWSPKSENNDATEQGCAAATAIQSINSAFINKLDNSKENMTFVIVGRLGNQVDICALSRPVEGRFGFESIEDASYLDNRIIGYGTVLETIGFLDEKNESTNESDRQTNALIPFSSPVPKSHRRSKMNKHTVMSLIVDPVSSSRNEQLIHYMGQSGVFTISTSIFFKTLKRIQKDEPTVASIDAQVKSNTTAWACISVGSGANISGAVVSGDPSLGHILVAQISTGSMEVVNLTSAQYLHRAATMSKATKSLVKSQAIESIPPFIENIAPLLRNIQVSFSSTGKMTGSKTHPKDVGPTDAAFVLETTQKLQKDIVEPLHELHDKTESHKKALFVLYQSQKKKLETLKSMMEKVKQNHEKSLSKFKAINKNASDLKIRSASILEASRSTNPKISQAEYDYFTQLKRWELQTNKWGDRLESIQNKVKTMQENQQNHFFESKSDDDDNGEYQCFLNLSEQQKQMCSDLLYGQELLLKKSKGMLTSVERDARCMMQKKGLPLEDINVVSEH